MDCLASGTSVLALGTSGLLRAAKDNLMGSRIERHCWSGTFTMKRVAGIGNGEKPHVWPMNVQHDNHPPYPSSSVGSDCALMGSVEVMDHNHNRNTMLFILDQSLYSL